MTAYRLASGVIVTQDASQHWCDEDGFPLPLPPNLEGAVALEWREVGT